MDGKPQPQITVGDVFEVLAAVLLVTAAAVWSGLVLALALSGAILVYFAHIYDDIGAR